MLVCPVVMGRAGDREPLSGERPVNLCLSSSIASGPVPCLVLNIPRISNRFDLGSAEQLR